MSNWVGQYPHYIHDYNTIISISYGGAAMMTSSNENIFRVTGPKSSDAELWCFLWYATEQTVEQTIQMPVIWDAIELIMTSL